MRELAELPATGDADIAALASLLADPARCKVLLALDDGRALPASVLADEAGVSRSTASSHLGKLTEAGFLTVQTHGRHRYYRLAGPEIGDLLERLGRLAPPRRVTSLREGTRAARLRSARTCYDHLAGRLGVEVMGALLERDVLVGGDGRYDPRLHPHDSPSNPGHDVDYELTVDGPRLSERRRHRITQRAKAGASLLHRLDRAAAPPGGRAWRRRAGSLRVGALDQTVAAGPRGDGHRRRPHRAGQLLRHRLARLVHRLRDRDVAFEAKCRFAMAR